MIEVGLLLNDKIVERKSSSTYDENPGKTKQGLVYIFDDVEMDKITISYHAQQGRTRASLKDLEMILKKPRKGIFQISVRTSKNQSLIQFLRAQTTRNGKQVLIRAVA